jgi:hypothetical protein
MKFYLSCRKPMPEPEIVDAEVGVALEDWEGIPTHELPGVCTDARRRANGFPPPNSLVVDAWVEERDRRLRVERDRELYERASEPPPPPLTAEQKAEMDQFFSRLRASLAGQ